MNSTRAAWALGLAGLIPFLAPAAMALSGKGSWLGAQHTYGACILAFLGALHWGPALNGSAKQPALLLAWGVVPSLIAWVALQWAGAQTGAWLAVGLMVTWAGDALLARFHHWPPFYLKLRTALTVVASAALFTPWLKRLVL